MNSSGADKEQFLQAIREALGKRVGESPPHHLPLKIPPPQQAQKVDTIWARVEARRPQLLERFADMAAKSGWRVVRVASLRDAAESIVALLRDVGARTVVGSDEPVLQRAGVNEALGRAGIAMTVMARAPGRSAEELRRLAAEAHAGVTGVEYAIAETGTCVLVPRRGISRLVSLLPPVHIAVVEPANVVETLDDVLAMRRLGYMRTRSGKGSYMNFITGPSRSGDIEQTITVGVHGPREAYCILAG